MINKIPINRIYTGLVLHTSCLYTMLLALLFSILFIPGAWAASKTFSGPGNFSVASLWNLNALPLAGDNLTINGTCTIDNNVLTDNIAYGTLIIGGTGATTLNWVAGGTNRLNVTNVSSSSAGSSLNMTNGGTLIIRGTWTSANLAFTPGAGTIDIRSAITLPAAYSTYNNLIKNGAGLTVILAATTTVTGNLTITSGTLNANNFNITIGSSWINNGSFTAGSGRVTFNGPGIDAVTGSSTTAFNTITIDKGTDYTSNILDVQSLITMTAGGLILTNGTFKLSSASTITPFTSDIIVPPFLIPPTAGLWCNGGTINTTTSMSFSLSGLLRISAGTFNQGSALNNYFAPQTGSSIIIEGGYLNVADRLSQFGAGWSFTMTGGTLTVPTVGNTTASRSPFNMDATGASFSMSGGTIVIERSGGAAGQNLGFLNLGLGGTGFTGGTLQIGNGSTPAAQTINIESTNPIFNLSINSANAIAKLSTSDLAITNNLTISSGALNANNLDISVGDNWTNNASTSAFTAGTATVTMTGINAGGIIGSSATTFNNLTISCPGHSVASGVNANVVGNLLVSAGVFNLSSYTVNRTGAGGTITVSNGATLRTGGTNGFPTNYSTTSLGATSTIEYYGTTQTVAARNYGHLTLSNSSVKTMPATALIIAGNFTMSGTASATALNSMSIAGNVILNSGSAFTGGTLTHTASGNWTNNGGTFTPGAGTVVFNGAGSQFINGTAASQTFNNIIVLKSSGTLLRVNGSTTTLTTNDFTETSGNFTAPSTMNIIAAATSSLTLSAGVFTAGIVTNITGDWINNGGTFTPGSNTVIFNGNGAQAIKGTAASQSFYNVILNKPASTILSVSGSTTTLTVQDFTETTGDFAAPPVLNINGSSTLSDGVFTAGTTTSVKGNWTNDGATFNPGYNMVVFNGSGAQAINGTEISQTFHNVTLTKTAGTLLNTGGSTSTITTNNFTATTGNFTAPATLNINGNLLLSAGTFTAGTTINASGNWTNNGGTFAPGIYNEVLFNGTVAQSINGTAAAQTFYNVGVIKTAGTLLNTGGSTTTLTVNNLVETTGNFTAPTTLNIDDNCTLNAGIFIAGTTINIAGNWINNGGNFTYGTSTVTFNSAWGQAIKGTATSQTFYDLVVSKTLSTTLNVNGSTTTLTTNHLTETTGNFTAPATLNINGNLLLSAGTFTAGTSINIQGNWTKNGGTFTPGSNVVNFIGTATKTLGGSNVNSFYNLTINTTASADIVQLTNDATATLVLTLTKGVLDLNSNTLFITSSLSAGITRSSGYILSEKTDNSSKICWTTNISTGTHVYPFGTVGGAYIPFTLTRTSGNLGQVTASTYPTAYDNTPYPTTPTLVTNMYSNSGSNNSPNVVDRFWQIEKEGVSATATLTFTATPAEIGTITSPTAQRYDGSTNKWQLPLPGQTNTATTATVPGVTNFSPWTLSGNGAMLPIELLNFTASLNETHVDLNWITASELNNDYFTVEKSYDLVNYEAVAIVDGAGNSAHSLNYSTPDTNPYSGVSYYRLKQTDYNGTETYSNVVSVSIDFSPDDFIAYPNPLIGTTINVKLPNESVNELQVIIYSMNGQIVYSKKVDANADGSFTVIPDHSVKLSSGMYLLTLISDTRSYQKKLIVE